MVKIKVKSKVKVKGLVDGYFRDNSIVLMICFRFWLSKYACIGRLKILWEISSDIGKSPV